MVVRSGILKHTIPVAINAVEVALNQDMKALDFSGEPCVSRFFLRWVQGLNGVLLLQWAKQGATVESIEHAYLAETVLPLPSDEEQASIATFLDRETAKIDALVAEYRTLIGLLKEKRQAVISHAVTKGLDPTVPMKDSGVEWLRDVPEHWKIRRNKALFHEVDSRSISGEGELLSVSHLTGVTPRSEKNVNMIMAETLEGYKECLAGDLVMNTMWAWMGALGISPCDGLVSPSYNTYRTRRSGSLNTDYSDLPLPHSDVCRDDKGSFNRCLESRLRLYADAFFSLRIARPPLEEQTSIVRFLNDETANLTP